MIYNSIFATKKYITYEKQTVLRRLMASTTIANIYVMKLYFGESPMKQRIFNNKGRCRSEDFLCRS